MGFFDRLSGTQDVARVIISFREDGGHRVTVERQPAAPRYLHGPVLAAALFLHYAAKALHTLGSGSSADELRQHLALSAVVLRMNKFEPFTSLIDRPGECSGRLQINRSGALSINTNFRVPLGETNNYVLDSVLLMLSHAVESQPAADDRGRIAAAVEALEQYYQTVADPGSFKALRQAAATAFECYRHDAS
jgi:hypothetical protein